MKEKVYKLLGERYGFENPIREHISEEIAKMKLGTMDADCEHDIEMLYNSRGDYKADYCKICGGVY